MKASTRWMDNRISSVEPWTESKPGMSVTATETPVRPTTIGALPFYYGWVMVAVGALAMLATMPGRTHGLGLVTERLLGDTRLELDRVRFGDINLMATLLGAAFCSPCGWLIDRFGLRFVLTTVVLVLAAVVLTMPLLRTRWHSLWQFVLPAVLDRLPCRCSASRSSASGSCDGRAWQWAFIRSWLLSDSVVLFWRRSPTAMPTGGWSGAESAWASCSEWLRSPGCWCAIHRKRAGFLPTATMRADPIRNESNRRSRWAKPCAPPLSGCSD